VDLEKNDRRMSGLMAPGRTRRRSGESVGKIIKRDQGLLQEFQEREIVIKDLARGWLIFRR